MQYGLIGFPLGHSYSKAFFTEKFRKEGLFAEYLNFPLEFFSRRILTELLDASPCLRGLNVTSPHKREAFSLADLRTPEAEDAGAANTLRFRRNVDSHDGWIVQAHNTDVEGFREAVRPLLRPDVHGALVCGTGGAADAVAVALAGLGVRATFVSRNPEAHPGAMAYGDVSALMLAENPLVVNATPVGTFPDTDACVSLPYNLMTDRNICVDLVYNPGETMFMRKSAGYGAAVMNGLAMLRFQALASYEFWNEIN